MQWRLGPGFAELPRISTGHLPWGDSLDQRAHKPGGLQHCWDAPEALNASQGRWLRKPSFSILWLPWRQENELISKTLNRTSVMGSCPSENLLSVLQKGVFQIRDDSKKLCVCVCVHFGGGWTEWNWTEFLDKEILSTLIMWVWWDIVRFPLIPVTRHMNLIQDLYFSIKKSLNMVSASLKCRGTFANKLFLLFNQRKVGWLGPFGTCVLWSSA